MHARQAQKTQLIALDMCVLVLIDAIKKTYITPLIGGIHLWSCDNDGSDHLRLIHSSKIAHLVNQNELLNASGTSNVDDAKHCKHPLCM